MRDAFGSSREPSRPRRTPGSECLYPGGVHLFDLDALGAGLPVADARPELERTSATGAMVVTAPPGTGNTTFVPPLIANLATGRGSGTVLLTQPRRVAVRAVIALARPGWIARRVDERSRAYLLASGTRAAPPEGSGLLGCELGAPWPGMDDRSLLEGLDNWLSPREAPARLPCPTPHADIVQPCGRLGCSPTSHMAALCECGAAQRS